MVASASERVLMNRPFPPEPRDRLFRTEDLCVDDVARRSTSGALWAMAAAAIKIVVQMGSVAIIARLVPPTEFGVVAMALPLVMIGVTLSNFGLAMAIIQRPQVTHRLANTLFWANVALALTICAVLLASSPLAARFYGAPKVGPVLAALSLSILFSAALVPYYAIIRRQMRFRAAETVTVLAEFLTAVIAVTAAWAGASYWAVVAQQILYPALSVLGLAIATRWRPSPPPLERAMWREARGAITFGGFIALSGLLTQAMQGLGTVIAGRMFSEAAAGAYFRSWTLANYPEARFGIALGGAFVPGLSRTTTDHVAFRCLYIDTLRRVAFLLAPLGVLLVSGADLIVALLLGPMWTEAGPVLAWLGLLAIGAPLTATLSWAMSAVGAARLMAAHAAIGLVLVGASMALTAHLGLNAMAAAYGLTVVCALGPILLFFASRCTPLDIMAVCRRHAINLAVAGATIALTLAVRRAATFDLALADLALVSVVIGACYVSFGLIDPALRRDAVALMTRLNLRRGP